MLRLAKTRAPLSHLPLVTRCSRPLLLRYATESQATGGPSSSFSSPFTMAKFKTFSQSKLGKLFWIGAVGSSLYLLGNIFSQEKIPPSVILKMNFEAPFPERSGPALFAPPSLSLRDVVEGLETATRDDRVKAIIATIGSESHHLPMAQVQELRDALKAFRQSNKPAYCHAESFDGASTDYYLASAFDRIVLQPSGGVMIIGTSIAVPFLRGFLEKLGIEPKFLQRYEYKNFVNTFTEKQFTKHHREATEALATSIYNQLVEGIAESRNLEIAKVKELIDKAPLFPMEARDSGLVDVVAYRDVAYSLLKGKVFGESADEATEQSDKKDSKDEKIQFMSFKKYVRVTRTEKKKDERRRYKLAKREMLKLEAERKKEELKKAIEKAASDSKADDDKASVVVATDTDKQARLSRSQKMGKQGVPKIAVIYGNGEIVRGHTPETTTVMGSKNISSAFRAAVRDKDIKAVVFRVNSPGGSATASDTIWWETVRAKEAGLPIVVSMGDYAASGGYYVSSGADKIFAQPATLTGSIGVLLGKFLINELMEKKLGITRDAVEKGAHSEIFSLFKDWKESEYAVLNNMADSIYRDFVERVANGRGMTYEHAHSLAKGRVWTGADAKAIGLVDELGGLSQAIEAAKQLAGPLPDGVEYEVVELPKPLTFIDYVSKEYGIGAEPEAEEDDDEEPDMGGFPFTQELAHLSWLVRVLKTLRVFDPFVRELESSARATRAPQYRMKETYEVNQ